MKYLVAAMAFAIVAGAPASAQQNSPQAGTNDAPVQKKVDGRKKVCRRVEVTGSIMRETICKTVDQWVAEEQASRGDFERIQNSQRAGSQAQ